MQKNLQKQNPECNSQNKTPFQETKVGTTSTHRKTDGLKSTRCLSRGGMWMPH